MENEAYKQKYLDVRRKNTLKKALILKNIFKELFLRKTEKEILYNFIKLYYICFI